jgi:hypothetical protein
MAKTPAVEGAPNATRVTFPTDCAPVEKTAAHELASVCGAVVSASETPDAASVGVSLASGGWSAHRELPADAGGVPWFWIRVTVDGIGEVVASEPAYLFAAVRLLATRPPAGWREGVLVRPTFALNRVLWDGILTQYWRTARNFDAEHYVRTLAESGFTHLEVNGLQAAMAMEDSVPTEFYAQFYNYCAGFNHFVETPLTKGLWPSQYLSANLQHLKRLAALGRKYGLKPGVVMFEPRTLPERFFAKYPTLRGARVDHPFRSRLPRYTLAQDHPVTRRHYRECVRALMKEVPDLDYISIWSNDSGAGFEHTASLYVGRNGGPYMIREWRNHQKIAEAAAASIVRYLELLRDTARETNPDFNVFFRIEPYKVEHDAILAGLGRGLELEAPSLLVHGYDLPYAHPRYPDQKGVAGTMLHDAFDPAEKKKLEELRGRGIEPAMHYTASGCWNHEPLIGIPYPRSLYRKLQSLRDLGAKRVSGFGGLLNTSRARWWPNPAVIRAAQFAPETSIDELLRETAAGWVGAEHAADLVDAWDALEEAILWQPMVPLFCAFGFVWQRTWDRPMVPDIEAVPEADRDYYERFMCVQPNNPGRVDYGRDVLFDLITQQSGTKMAADFDRECLPRVRSALERIDAALANASDRARAAFVDLRDRAQAYLHWCTALRNVCGWVSDVYGYIEAKDEATRAEHEARLQRTLDLETENTRGLLRLWETSATEFMVVSAVAENGFIYGDNFGELLRRKLELMAEYRHRKPWIDRNLIWRIEGLVDWPEGRPQRPAPQCNGEKP